MMQPYFLGVDVGATKTHALVVDGDGQEVGFGIGGPGNHGDVGYLGLRSVLKQSIDEAVKTASISSDQLIGAGFGIAGYDWPSEKKSNIEIIHSLGFNIPFEVVNDTVLGLPASAREGWGVAVVSGTGCNCWGWDRTHQKIGRVTGNGFLMGEAAGASQLVFKAIQAITYQWEQRGPATALTPAFLNYFGLSSLEELIEGVSMGRLSIDGFAAPIIFKVAEASDPIANQVINWAAYELAELVKCVIRQLDFQELDFDVVLVGSMFINDRLLIEPMRKIVQEFSPKSNLVKLNVPPVAGAVLLGVEASGRVVEEEFRANLNNTISKIRKMG
jgi:N-acetylglucosamine kinase-like BadF-type ATPase